MDKLDKTEARKQFANYLEAKMGPSEEVIATWRRDVANDRIERALRSVEQVIKANVVLQICREFAATVAEGIELDAILDHLRHCVSTKIGPNRSTDPITNLRNDYEREIFTKLYVELHKVMS